MCFIASGSAFYSCLMWSHLNPLELAVRWERELSWGERRGEGSLSPMKVLGGELLHFTVRPQTVLSGGGVSRDDSYAVHRLLSCS